MKSINSFLLVALIMSFFVFASCNSGTSNDKKDNGNDMVSESSGDGNGSNQGNNVVTKKGLPLSPKQEVPPVTNSSASGTADISYNRDRRLLTFTINWTGLTDNPIMSHIHGPAAKGANTGVKHDFSNSLPKTTSGSFSDSVKIDDVGIKEDSLLAGFYYINIHTPKNKPGEIRGQIEF